MQDSWLSKNAEIQSFADRKNMKKFFDAFEYVVPRAQEPPIPLCRLTDKEAILKRWAEHFDGVLNRPSSINDTGFGGSVGCAVRRDQ